MLSSCHIYLLTVLSAFAWRGFIDVDVDVVCVTVHAGDVGGVEDDCRYETWSVCCQRR